MREKDKSLMTFKSVKASFSNYLFEYIASPNHLPI
ncbi:MAG: hypothetical protein K0R06_1233 [Clostridium sp.]|jgi:hypothetical protein|nr:hypothetical protein [Clostridium sp.]